MRSAQARQRPSQPRDKLPDGWDWWWIFLSLHGFRGSEQTLMSLADAILRAMPKGIMRDRTC